MTIKNLLFPTLLLLFGLKIMAQPVVLTEADADSCLKKSLVFNSLGQLDSAIQFDLAALEKFQQLDRQPKIAQVFNHLGTIYHELLNYATAVEYYLKAQKIWQSLDNQSGFGSTLSDLSLIYMDQGEFPKAFEYGWQALRLHEQLRDTAMIGYDLFNLAIFSDETGQFDQALDFYQRAMNTGQNDRGLCLNNMATTWLNKKEPARALDFARQAANEARRKGQDDYLALANSTFSEIYLSLGELDLAEKFGREGLAIAERIGELNIIQSTQNSVYQVLQKNGDWHGALDFYKKYIGTRDSIGRATSQTEVTRRLMQFEFDKRQQADRLEQEKQTALAAAELQQQKVVRNVSFLLVAVMLGVAWLFYRNFRREQRVKKLVEVEKGKSDALLLNILPAFAAEELKTTGQSEARFHEGVTVFFSDFIDFTVVSEQINPSDLVKLIHFYFSEFDRIMGRFGLEKIKTIGDAYVAVAGLDGQNGAEGARRAVGAALEIQAFMARQSAIGKAEKQPFFEARIGLNSGSVVAGVVGLKKFTYDIWSDTVNLAARMEQAGETGKVNISENTFLLVNSQFNCSFRGKMNAKNKGEVAMYFVENNESAAVNR